jgi:hypothetical protein
LNLNGPLSSPPQARIRVTPPLPRVVEGPRFVLADSALRALLDEFLTRNGNRVRLSRIEIENVGPDGEALDNTHVGVEGVLLKPVEGGYDRIDVSLGWSQKMGFKEGCTTTRVAVAPGGPFFPIDTGLCLTVERLIATLKGRGRPSRHFHHIVFSYADGRKDHPVWNIDYTRHRALFGPRREKATVDDVTGEASFQII